MDFDLSSETLSVQESLRKFVARNMPRELARKWDHDNVFPKEVFAQLADLGVLGLTFSEEYGGHGRDILTTLIVIEELSRRSMAMAVPYIMGVCYAGMNLFECGSEEQRKALLPKVTAGELLFAYGWTEPDVGGDLANVRTKAVRKDGEVIINGRKRFCSGALIADYIYTLVRSNNSGNRAEDLSLILIPRDAPGVTIERIDGLGMKGAATCDVTLDDVRVPVENIMGGESGWNSGWKMLTGAGLDVEKLEVAAMSLGIASAALDDAWQYASERKQFGKPIAEFQSIRHKLADMKAKLHAARLTTYHAGWLAGEGRRCGVETSMTKLLVAEWAKDIVLEAQTVLGAYGYVKSVDMERYVRDILVMPIIGGSSAIQRNNIANWLRLGRDT
jgi:alkylation response protein AidB-like acyl-CoA dehydrogenase